MSANSVSVQAEEPEAFSDWIDEIADRFEDAWRGGGSPRLADFLGDAAGERRIALLHELIQIDVYWRHRRGVELAADDYAREFPESAGPDFPPPYPPPSLGEGRVGIVDRPAHEDAGSTPASPSISKAEAGTGARLPVARRSVPATIGKYVVIRELARGGEARVYKAVHSTLDKEVAIKWSAMPLPNDPAVRDRFLAEGRLLADFDHPNLVRVFDADVAENRMYLVLEYVRGQNLDQYGKAARIQPRQAAKLVAQAARAMAAVHARGVVHLDLKPHNILIDPHGNARIIDFGLACLRDIWSESDLSGSGTPAYMAPEQARGEKEAIGPRTDVFGLGGVLYFLLTGSPLFPGNREEAESKAIDGKIDRSALSRARVPRRLERICLRALAEEPEKRQAGAEQLASELEGFLRRRRFAVALATIPLAVFAAVLLWMGLHRDGLPNEPVPKPELRVRVYRDKKPRDLEQAVPLRTGDSLYLEADVFPGWYVSLFMVDSENRLRELHKVAPENRLDKLCYPPGESEAKPLKGKPGTEFLIVCGSRSGPVSEKEMQTLWTEIQRSQQQANPWPALPDDSLLRLDYDQVKAVTGARGFDDEVEQVADPERQIQKLLDELRRRLRDQYPYLTGVAFPHADLKK